MRWAIWSAKDQYAGSSKSAAAAGAATTSAAASAARRERSMGPSWGVGESPDDPGARAALPAGQGVNRTPRRWSRIPTLGGPLRGGRSVYAALRARLAA